MELWQQINVAVSEKQNGWTTPKMTVADMTRKRVRRRRRVTASARGVIAPSGGGSLLRHVGTSLESAPMDGFKKWMSDNQVFSGLAVAVLTMLGGVIAYFYQRRRKASQTANTTQQPVQQIGNVGTGNVVNVQAPVGSLAVGAAAPVAPHRNLSEAANHLLMEILNDTRSDPKGLSLMTFSPTQGSYVPYLWDNQVHGQLTLSLTNIMRTRMAADELVRAGVFEPIQHGDQLTHYVLKPEHEWLT